MVEHHQGTGARFLFADRLGAFDLIHRSSAPFFVFLGGYMKKVGIIMGSDSDLPIIKKATDMLKALEIPFEVHIYSAHRTPVEARDFAVNA